MLGSIESQKENGLLALEMQGAEGTYIIDLTSAGFWRWYGTVFQESSV